MIEIILFILLGLSAGILSGLIGIGGGILLVPVLHYIFKLSQHQAQGTTLALMVPPIGLLAAYTYYKAGNVNLKIAVFVCLGFFVGGLFGAKLAGILPAATLKKIFGIVLLATGIKMILN